MQRKTLAQAYAKALLNSRTGITFSSLLLATCVDDYCGPHGDCKVTQLANRLWCECHVGYTGEFCDKRKGDCGASGPCVNGDCLNIGGSWSCVCDEGFTGLTCDTGEFTLTTDWLFTTCTVVVEKSLLCL